MDTIYIRDLEVYANHGVFQEEKKMGQLFVISLELYLDLKKAGMQDDLNATVNYAEICNEITNLMQKTSYNLIESCAQAVAVYMLQTYKALEGVKVLIKKPWAPIGKSLAYAAVEIERQWHRVYLGIGSNLGDKRKNLDDAVAKLNSDTTKAIRVSGYHETAPVSDIPQDDYLNAAVEIKTQLTPDELIDFLMGIETQLGRERTLRWGPRTIDLDILLYDSIISESEKATLPHPRMHERLFVLEPLSEIAPYAIHPLLNKRIIELCSQWKQSTLSDLQQA